MISPCVKICVIDEPSRQCLGCGRTLWEIGGWSQMSDTERTSIMDALPQRMERLAQVTK